MLVLTPKDNLFNYDEVKALHNKYKDLLEDRCSFDELLEKTHFFSFYVGKKFIGCVYACEKDGKVFISGFSNRKTHKENIECLKKVINFYNCDIYAESTQRPAIICLLRAGFKKIDTNIYKNERR